MDAPLPSGPAHTITANPITNSIVTASELTPDLMIKLFSYQVPHVMSLYHVYQSGHNAALDGSGTGLGKTSCTCALSTLLGMSLFVIAPLSVLVQWFETAERFGATVLGAVNYESLKNGKYYTNIHDCQRGAREVCPYVLPEVKVRISGGERITEIENFKWSLPPNTLIVFDEAHRGKNGFGASSTLNNRLVASSRAALNRAERRYLLLLSATITDKLENADCLTYVLGMYKPYTRQAYKRFESHLRTLAAESKSTALGKLHEMIYPKLGSSMPPLESEAAKQSQIRAKIFIVSHEIAAQIETKHKRIRALLAEIRAKGPTRGFGEIIRHWTQLELLKVPSAVEWAWRKLRKSYSVVIFTNFNETRNQIHDNLVDQSKNPAYAAVLQGRMMSDLIVQVHGGQTLEERRENIAKFQRDEAWVAIVNIRAGGVGISLHALGQRARRGGMFPTWAAIDLLQGPGRLIRAGMTQAAKVRVIYCSDVKEETLAAAESVEVTTNGHEQTLSALPKPLPNAKPVAQTYTVQDHPILDPSLAELDGPTLVPEAEPIMVNDISGDLCPEDLDPEHLSQVKFGLYKISTEVMLCRNVRQKLGNISELHTGHFSVAIENFELDV